jgi:hypothetical protein
LERSSNSKRILNSQSKNKSNFEFRLNFKGVRIFEENSINSPKTYLDIIFNTVNLD